MREEIKTARLLLRRFRESDYDDLYEFLSQLEDDEFEGYPGITYENGRAHLQQRLGSEAFYAVVLKDSGKVIGNIYCGARDFAAKEVGYIINKDYQRQGYAAEALSAVVQSAFQDGAHRIYADCDPRNTASWKLLESVGFRREAYLRQNIYFRKDADGAPIWKDTCVYAILENDETNKLCRESVEKNRIIPVDQTNLDQAAFIHSVSWKEAHRSFCSPDFIDLHSPEHQRVYLSGKMKNGAKLYMLTDGKPMGIVSVTNSLIEDLYVLPDMQNRGCGTRLLQFAIDKCEDTPTLWILENNTNAGRLYRRMGFTETGRKKRITDGLNEIEFKMTMDHEGTGAVIILETERLFLREMDKSDYDALYRVLADTEIMRHYPYTFDEALVRAWIERNIDRYRVNGFGLWAVCLKESGEMIGDCGLTLQIISGNVLPEIGYHIRRDFQRRGYAKEAAKAVRDWAFRNTDYPALYSYCKYTNVPSIRTAESIGMHFCCDYPDEANGTTYVSVISKEDWLNRIGTEVINQQKEGLQDGI